MKKLQSAGALIVALSMGMGSLAMAQDRGRDNDRRGPDRGADNRDGGSRWERGDNRGPAPQFDGNRGNGPRPAVVERRNDGRDDWRGDGRNDGRGGDRRADGRGRGAGPDHRFYRGDRLPPAYRSRQYVVEDWRGHRLSAPPRGYHWVQTGGDYVLAAVATGVILQILLNQ